jgi:hypothetical protein
MGFDGAQNAANWPPSPPDPSFADYFRRGRWAVRRASKKEVAECLRRAADAKACADDTNDPKGKAEYQRIAES